jgi:hypothetical protein
VLDGWSRALRTGGPEVIDVRLEELAPLKTGEALVRVAAAGYSDELISLLPNA